MTDAARDADPIQTAPSAKPAAMAPLLKVGLEIGPLAVFFIAFNQLKHLGDTEALVWATGAFMAALAVSMSVTYALTRTVSKIAAVTTVVVLVMGGLTIWLKDETFIKLKPTIVNGLFAAVLGFGLLRGESYLRYLLGDVVPITDAGWMKLTRNWALFFLTMAILNEVVWRSFSTETWVDVKTFAYLPLTLLFTISQAPLMTRHALPEDQSAA